MEYVRALLTWLGNKNIIRLLFIVNFLGTIYGYYWYKNQLAETPLNLWPFVPDSPTASLFFTMILLAFLLEKRWPMIEALAAITLFKYGIWATVMIIWGAMLGAPLYFAHYMLIFSHLGMAVQALLYSPYFTFKFKHLFIAASWTLINDFMDYVLGIFPWVNQRLHPYLPFVAGFTVSLSVISIIIFYLLVIKRKGKNLEIIY